MSRDALTRSLPPDEKRERIFAAARGVITERGFDGAKMEDIAARAGVGKGTLYNFFASKEELLLSLVLDGFERTRDLIDAEIDPISDPWMQLEVGWRTLMLRVFPDLVRQWNLNYQFWGLLARDASARERLFTSWRQLYRERESAIAAAIEAGQKSGHFRPGADPRAIALLLLSIFDGLLHRSMFDPERVEPRTALAAVLDMLRRELSPQDPSAES